MSEEIKLTKQQQEDKIRCTQYLLEMIEEYGAEVLEDMKKEESASKQ